VTALLWQAGDGGSEICVLERAGKGSRLRGTVLTHEAKEPIELRYTVTVDAAWATTDVEVLVSLAGGEPHELVDLGALWSGKERPPEFEDCVDVDLSFTPSTNTLPIRRLRLGIGGSHTIQAAWVRFPELTVVKAAQTYTRLDEFTYRYASGDFEAELTVDDDSLVASYAVWQRTGVSMGPDDTEPLDTHR
jgi:uncharacterized protein